MIRQSMYPKFLFMMPSREQASAATKALCIILSIQLLGGCFKTREDIEKEREEKEMQQTLNKNIYEQTESLQQTQSQIGKIQGRIEEMEHNRKREQENLHKALNQAVEKMNQIEQRLGSNEKTQADLIEEVKKIKQDNIRLLGQNTNGSAVKKKTEKNAFKLGAEAYDGKRYKEAIDHLQQFIQQSPQSKNIIHANFMLGQSQYALKNYEEAILAYSTVYEKNGKDDYWKKSTLKIAEAFRKLGKKKDAQPFAQSLVDRFPDSAEARIAKKYLN